MDPILTQILKLIKKHAAWAQKQDIDAIKEAFLKSNLAHKTHYLHGIKKLIRAQMMNKPICVSIIFDMFKQEIVPDYIWSLVTLDKAQLLNDENYASLGQRQAPIGDLLFKLYKHHYLNQANFTLCIQYSLHLCETSHLRNHFRCRLDEEKIVSIFDALIQICQNHSTDIRKAQQEIFAFIKKNTKPKESLPQAARATESDESFDLSDAEDEDDIAPSHVTSRDELTRALPVIDALFPLPENEDSAESLLVTHSLFSFSLPEVQLAPQPHSLLKDKLIYEGQPYSLDNLDLLIQEDVNDSIDQTLSNSIQRQALKKIIPKILSSTHSDYIGYLKGTETHTDVKSIFQFLWVSIYNEAKNAVHLIHIKRQFLERCLFVSLPSRLDKAAMDPENKPFVDAAFFIEAMSAKYETATSQTQDEPLSKRQKTSNLTSNDFSLTLLGQSEDNSADMLEAFYPHRL